MLAAQRRCQYRYPAQANPASNNTSASHFSRCWMRPNNWCAASPKNQPTPVMSAAQTRAPMALKKAKLAGGVLDMPINTGPAMRKP